MGRHFEAAVRELKRRFPQATLTVVGPTWRALPLHQAGLVDRIVTVSRDKLRLSRDFSECVHILATIRRDRCDLLVTMYDSPGLNVLHSLSGCPSHAVFDARARLYALRVRRFYAVRMVCGAVARTIVGALTYVLIRNTLGLWSLFRRRG
jgi:ADP-heptose:LPS heptosyltransferase